VPSDSTTESTTFTVTVTPAPVVVPPPVAPPPPPVVQLPPPATTLLVAPFTPITTIITATEGGTSTDTSRDDELAVRASTSAIFTGESFTTTVRQTFGPSEGRTSLAPPSPGSLFGQPESPLPAYAGGEKHPLPPVLPLDQTLPVAGFTDSGGDSLALVDRIYRDAKSTLPQTGVSRIELLEIVVPAEWVGPAVEAPAAPKAADSLAAIGFFTPRGANPADGAPAAEAGAEANESEWRLWAGGAVVAGALAVWAWTTRGPEWIATRLTRRLFRAIPRRATERTA
jgi:hypothetical protein